MPVPEYKLLCVITMGFIIQTYTVLVLEVHTRWQPVTRSLNISFVFDFRRHCPSSDFIASSS